MRRPFHDRDREGNAEKPGASPVPIFEARNARPALDSCAALPSTVVTLEGPDHG